MVFAVFHNFVVWINVMTCITSLITGELLWTCCAPFVVVRPYTLRI